MRQRITNGKGFIQILSRLRHAAFPSHDDHYYPRPQWFHWLRSLIAFFWLIPSFFFLAFLNNYYLTVAFSNLGTLIRQKGAQALLSIPSLLHALELDQLPSLLREHSSLTLLPLAVLLFGLIGFWAKRDRQREKLVLAQREEKAKERRKQEDQRQESQRIVEEVQRIHRVFEPRLPPLPDEGEDRTIYLRELCERYNYITLPIGPALDLPLPNVFQPLKLRRDPIVTPNLVFAKNRTRATEMTGNSSPPGQENPSEPSVVIVDSGDEALSKSPHGRIVVLGGPGTGKTTVLKSLIAVNGRKALSHPDAPLPIFISLPDLARSSTTLHEYLIRVVRGMKIGDHCAEMLQKAIECGNAFICLDSLDEVVPALRPEVIKMINEMASDQGNIWIVGSRFTEYKGGQFKRGQFVEWELQPMDHELRQQLAQRLLPEIQMLLQNSTEVRNQKPTAFVDLLENHPKAAAWGENPLFFCIALVVYAYTATLPSSRAMLYQQVIDAVLEMREPDATRRKILRRVLADLALELYKIKGRTFTGDDLLTLVPEVRARQRENWLTDEMVTRVIGSGVLEVIANEAYSFKHQTFQEYLAAVELVRRLLSFDQQLQEETWAFAWSKRTYSRWAEILRLMIGILFQTQRKEGVKVALHWLHDLTAQHLMSEDPGYLGLALAIQSLAEVAEEKIDDWRELRDIEVKTVETWVAELLSSSFYRRRIRTWVHGHVDTELLDTERRIRLRNLATEVRHLSSSSVNMAREKLLDTLIHGERNQRVEAAKVLGVLKASVPIEVLTAVLGSKYEDVRRSTIESFEEQIPTTDLLAILNDADWHLVARVRNILEKRGEQVPVELLRATLQNGKEHARISAIVLLYKLGESVSLEQLLGLLNNTRWEVRFDVVNVLGDLGDDAPIDPLLAALGDEDWGVRRCTASTIGRLGSRVPIESIVAALHDQKWQVRSTAAEALGKLGVLAPVDPLLEALGDEDERVRREAAAALGELGARTPIEPLLTILSDENVLARMEAAEALGKLGARVQPISLIRVLDDPDLRVRKAAAQAFGRLDDDELLDSLLLDCSKRIWWTRAAAIQLLAKLAPQVPIDRLVSAVEDPSGFIREAAVQSLGGIGIHAPIEPIMGALRDKYSWVRWAAAEALGKLGDRVPVESLITALENENWRVREVTVETLGKLGNRVPIEPLLNALQDETEEVRLAAVKGLGKLGKAVPIESLVALLQDKSWRIRKAAIGTLGELGEQVPRNILEAALHDDVEEVRRTTVQALGKLRKKTAIDVLMTELLDGDESVRAVAAWALKEADEIPPIEPLVSALGDSMELVREGVVTTLGRTGKQVPILSLEAALGDSSWRVREAAVHAFGALEAHTAVKYLTGALHDDVASVRTEAVEVIGKLGEQTPIEELMQLIDDEDPGVRAAMIRALGGQVERVPVELFVAALADTGEQVRDAAAQSLQVKHFDVLLSIMPEALAVVDGQEPQQVFLPLKQSFIAEAIGNMGRSSPKLLELVSDLLQCPYWEVRMHAAQALGKVRRNIPDPAIRNLLKLRHDQQSRSVREAADNALAAILSLETGIEDD